MIKNFLKNLSDLRKDKDSIYLIIIVFFLIVFGILAISSCGTMVDIKNPTACFRNHCMNIIIGLGAFCVSYFINYKYYKRSNLFLFIFMTILLIIPLFCRPIKGAHRWIPLVVFNFQPSEISKIVLTIMMASFITKYKEFINTWEANIFPVIYLGIFVLIIAIFQSDLGTAALLTIIWFSLLFIAKLNTKRILIFVLVFLLGLSTFVLMKDYRRQRVVTYVQHIVEVFVKDKTDNIETKNKPKALKDDAKYNSEMSFAAFGSGGILGKGAGNSELKLNYLPEKHTDYIFPIIGEEYGLLTGTLIIVLLFMFFTKVTLSIHKKCNDEFGKYLSFGIMLIICIQAIVNMAMTVGLIPAKGFPLPFISYGGSSMLINFYMLGILVNISRNNNNYERKYSYSR